MDLADELRAVASRFGNCEINDPVFASVEKIIELRELIRPLIYDEEKLKVFTNLKTYLEEVNLERVNLAQVSTDLKMNLLSIFQLKARFAILSIVSAGVLGSLCTAGGYLLGTYGSLEKKLSNKGLSIQLADEKRGTRVKIIGPDILKSGMDTKSITVVFAIP